MDTSRPWLADRDAACAQADASQFMVVVLGLPYTPCNPCLAAAPVTAVHAQGVAASLDPVTPKPPAIHVCDSGARNRGHAMRTL